jgi:hypothetical protein
MLYPIYHQSLAHYVVLEAFPSHLKILNGCLFTIQHEKAYRKIHKLHQGDSDIFGHTDFRSAQVRNCILHDNDDLVKPFPLDLQPNLPKSPCHDNIIHIDKVEHHCVLLGLLPPALETSLALSPSLKQHTFLLATRVCLKGYIVSIFLIFALVLSIHYCFRIWQTIPILDCFPRIH